MGDEQTEFKKEMKQWLRAHGLGYRWVAEQCGVSEITVRNWMSQKNIPPLKEQLLKRVMVQLPSVSSSTQMGVMSGVSVQTSFSLTVQLESSMYNRLAARAAADGTTMEQMVASAIARLVSASDGNAPIVSTRKVLLPGE
ncbi:MAG: hypothetical protein IJ985_07625 [Akkermansia sp.]|nr:hypothetical protein [Akkermansia sp.]MBR3944213.1 hypothetical protein [Akkermansia sp.]